MSLTVKKRKLAIAQQDMDKSYVRYEKIVHEGCGKSERRYSKNNKVGMRKL